MGRFETRPSCARRSACIERPRPSLLPQRSLAPRSTEARFRRRAGASLIGRHRSEPRTSGEALAPLNRSASHCPTPDTRADFSMHGSVLSRLQPAGSFGGQSTTIGVLRQSCAAQSMARKHHHPMPSCAKERTNERPDTMQVGHEPQSRASNAFERRALHLLVISRATVRINAALFDDRSLLERERNAGRER